jgi:vitamin B12 transporter
MRFCSIRPAGRRLVVYSLDLFYMTSIVTRPVAATVKPLALAIATMAAYAAFSPSASAQTQDKTLAPMIVTATRSPQIAKEVLSDNVVITSEDIAQSGHTSLVDLLQRQRGLEVTRNGGPGTSSSVFVRGADNKQNIVLIDGVRVGSSTLGGATWSAIPLSQIDRIEIVYGPLSSLYGADAIGGVIQIFTKKGEGAPAPMVSAGAGSYGARNLEAGISGSTGGDHAFHYALSAAHEAADSFSATKRGAFGFNPDKDGYKGDSASGRFGLALAKGHEVGLTFLQSRLDAQFDSSPSFDDRNLQRLETLALYSKNQLLPNWASNLQLSETADKVDTSASFGKTFINTKQTDLSWQHDISLGTDVLQLVLERREEKVDTSTTELNGKRSTNSVAAAYQLKRGAHLASVSLRNDNSSQFGAHSTGSVAYGYRITNALRANASYGTSFRAPTFNELYYPGYGIASNRPEQGKNAEVGLYYEDGKSQLSAVYYRNRVTDLLVNTPVCPVEQATHPFGCAYNVDQALLTGLSFGASTRLGSFTVRGTLDLQDPRDETTDRVLQRRAKKHGTVSADYAAGAVKVGSEVIFSGRRFDDTPNRNVLGGYGLLNLYANYDFAKNWSIFGRWNNVLNKDYELIRNYNTAGSNVFVGVRYGMR